MSHTKPKVKICALQDVFASRRIPETSRSSENIHPVSVWRKLVSTAFLSPCVVLSPHSPPWPSCPPPCPLLPCLTPHPYCRGRRGGRGVPDATDEGLKLFFPTSHDNTFDTRSRRRAEAGENIERKIIPCAGKYRRALENGKDIGVGSWTKTAPGGCGVSQ